MPTPEPRPALAPELTGRLDIEQIRRDFPILDQQVHGKRLVYLDSAASAQKPSCVLEAATRFCKRDYSNVHRGLHELSTRSTDLFEGARDKVARFIGAADCSEIIFTSGTTAAINLVAHSFGQKHVAAGDEIVITEMEHHSNIVPWQLLCQRSGAKLRVAPIDDAGELDLDALAAMLTARTRLVAVTHVSNALGTRNPVRRIVEMAHRAGAAVLVDGAQALPHEAVDVRAIGCDFYAFSAHKMFGPTGIGVLYGRRDRLDEMPPFLGGGEMIHAVSFTRTSYKEPPYRFEAGTPDIVGAIGLSAAIDYMLSIGLDRIAEHDRAMLDYGTRRLEAIPGLRLIGTAGDKSSILSFTLEGIHPHDVGTVLNHEGIAVRAGHHCAQPVMDRLGVPATTRASLALYNGREDIDALAAAIPRVIEVFG